MIPLYPCFNAMLLKFLSFTKYFCASLFCNDIPYFAKLRYRKAMTLSGENVTRFCFNLDLSFYVQR